MFTTHPLSVKFQKPIQNRSYERNRLTLLATAGICLVLLAEPASANVLDNFGAALIGIVNNVFLKAVATLAVIATGIMALSGRIEWNKFLMVLLAVVIIFGATGIVNYIQTNSATAALATPPLFERTV